MTSSGAFGQLLSEWGKSDSQHSMSVSNQSMCCTPIWSLMKHERKWRLNTSVGPL